MYAAGFRFEGCEILRECIFTHSFIGITVSVYRRPSF